MILTPTELQQITDAAYRAFEPREVAHLLGKPASEFTKLFYDESHPAVIAYLKGIYQVQSNLRAALIDSALSGSSPAQNELKKHIDKAYTELKLLIP
ncbi:MAG: hypothetical protein L6Q78_11015 [Bacteroidia bacterium]|nr:hypothetical protein [Bacteroidia bacterium]